MQTGGRTSPAGGELHCERQADGTLLVRLVGPWTIHAGAPVVTEVYEQLDASRNDLVDVRRADRTREPARPQPLERRLHERADGQGVASRHEVDRGPHQPDDAHRPARLEQALELLWLECVDTRPEPNVRVRWLLCLHAHEPLDDLDCRHAHTLEQHLTGEEGPIELAARQDSIGGHRPIR